MPTQNSAITPGALGPAGPQGPAGNDSQDLNCLGPWGTWVTYNNTGTQHDVAYPLASGGIRKTSGGDVTITTVEATVPSVTDGQCLFIENISTTGVITIPDEFVQPSTRTANRFNMPNNQPCVIGLNEVAHFRWSAATSRWTLVSKTHPCDDGPAELTPRQLQQIACVPTTIGLTPTAQTGTGTFGNVTRGAATVGYAIDTDNATGRTWTGLDCTGADDGECFQMRNVGTGLFTLAHENASSAAWNRFTLPGGRSLVLEPNEHVVLQYQGACGTTGRWVAVADGDGEAGLTAAQTLSLTCIPTVLGLTPLTASPATNGNHYPAGNVGYEYTGAADASVFGLQAKPNGTCCQWHNGSTKDVNFIHLSGGATLAGNRIALPESDTPGDTYKMKPGSHMVMQYRTTTPAGSIIPGNVWVVTSITEGE